MSRTGAVSPWEGLTSESVQTIKSASAGSFSNVGAHYEAYLVIWDQVVPSAEIRQHGQLCSGK